jgi:hypothetical protein
MLSSPDARGSKGDRFGLGGSQSVAKSSTIWYSHARANPINSATSERRYHRGQSNR